MLAQFVATQIALVLENRKPLLARGDLIKLDLIERIVFTFTPIKTLRKLITSSFLLIHFVVLYFVLRFLCAIHTIMMIRQTFF